MQKKGLLFVHGYHVIIPLSLCHGNTPSREGAVTLPRKRQEAFRTRLTAHAVQGTVIKLPIHNNTDQRELRAHIGSLQKDLDKPMHRGALSLVVEESFHILDIREELALPKDAMLAAVKEVP